MQAEIPPEVFYSNIEKVRQIWANNFAHQFDTIILINGKATAGNEKTVAIISWLLAAYNLTDTIFAFSEKEILIYASERKITFLNSIKEHPSAKKFNLIFFQKVEDGAPIFQNMWNLLHNKLENPKIGLFVKDDRVGVVAEEFSKFMENNRYTPVDISSFFNECFVSKSKDEIDNLKKSALVTTYFLQKLIKEVEKVIDEGNSTSHLELSKKMQQILNTEAELKKCAIKITNTNSANLTINKDYIDMGPSINVQSGGMYSVKLFGEPTNTPLKSDCILVSLGTLYKSYNSFASRTLLIDPTDDQKLVYRKSLGLLKVIQQNLRPGLTLSSVYKKSAEFVKQYLPQVEIPKSFGFGIGIFLCQNALQICQSNNRNIERGSSFLINCSLAGFKSTTKKGEKNYAIQIMETVVVNEKGQEVLTSGVSTSLSDISYELGDDEEENKPKNKNPNIIQYENTDGRPVTRRGKKYEVTVEKLKNQKKRNDHQMQLKKKKLEELKQRVHENFMGGFKKQKNIEFARLESYKTKNDIPKEMKKNQIYVDSKNHSILLPINGVHIPFHVHTLKSVVKNDEGKCASLRFNFLLPGSASNVTFPKFNEATIYVKQMVFRSQQLSRIADLEKQIKALQKKVRLDIHEKHAKEDIVEQQVLKLNKGKRPVLRDLFSRPNSGLKKVKGNLECHLNGFRYTSIKGEHIDVTFSNIKYAFFQPCEQQIIAAIHFKLHEPIMIGKKKSDDIQFYSEGGPNAEDVGGRGRGGYGGEDSDDEQRQKESRKRLDKEFQIWMKSCEQFKGKYFQFEIPNRSGGFYGNHTKHNSLIQPTRNCLINITESPFFVCPIDEMEVVCFERMYANSKTFDIIIILKDYENHLKINAIPIRDAEKVKNWLDSENIIFYEQGKTLNWIKFLGTIRKDFKKFVSDGGWMAWDEADEEEEGRDLEGDESYSMSESDDYEDSQDSDDDSSGYQDEDDSDSDEQEDLSEEGLSSQELEERAERQDRERERREKQKERLRMMKKK